ncbi:uncharacterized protein LOC144179963 [Haemaphysalis longicornis]
MNQKCAPFFTGQEMPLITSLPLVHHPAHQGDVPEIGIVEGTEPATSPTEEPSSTNHGRTPKTPQSLRTKNDNLTRNISSLAPVANGQAPTEHEMARRLRVLPGRELKTTKTTERRTASEGYDQFSSADAVQIPLRRITAFPSNPDKPSGVTPETLQTQETLPARAGRAADDARSSVETGSGAQVSEVGNVTDQINSTDVLATDAEVTVSSLFPVLVTDDHNVTELLTTNAEVTVSSLFPVLVTDDHNVTELLTTNAEVNVSSLFPVLVTDDQNVTELLTTNAEVNVSSLFPVLVTDDLNVTELLGTSSEATGTEDIIPVTATDTITLTERLVTGPFGSTGQTTEDVIPIQVTEDIFATEILNGSSPAEWATQRPLQIINEPETTVTTTSRKPRTRRSRGPITERSRKPLPYSRQKVPGEKSLVCAITEDFNSYWLSFGFPFRYADRYPDHLCTHYIFSALVFDDNTDDLALYPNNFYRLERFVKMRRESNVTFIVSFDADYLLRKLRARMSGDNMRLFANNVHVFLRYYDFDGFDVYKVHFTDDNVAMWTQMLQILSKELRSEDKYLLSIGFTYDANVPTDRLVEALKHLSFSNLITHAAPIDIWNTTKPLPPNHFGKLKQMVEDMQAVRQADPNLVMCYTLTLCVAHYIVHEGTPFNAIRGEFFNFHEMSCDRISEMDTDQSRDDGISVVSGEHSIYYAYDTTDSLLSKIRQLEHHGMCAAMFDVQCDDTEDCEGGRYSRLEAVKKEVGVLNSRRLLLR